MRAFRALAVGGLTWVLASQVACLDGFGQLVTKVQYDPATQSFRVERRLENVEASFFACTDVSGCLDSMAATLSGTADPLTGLSHADRLIARLRDTGAEDLEVRLEARGNRLDVVATYLAPLSARAAEDTLIHAEYEGEDGKGRYYLVVDAQPGLVAPTGKYLLRRISQSGSDGVAWREAWVLPPTQREVDLTLVVKSTAQALFEQVPGLDQALKDAGWLDGPLTFGVAPVLPPPPLVAQVPPPSSEEAVSPPAPAPAVPDVPAPAPVAVSAWPAPDPASPGRVYVHPPQVLGTLSASAVEASAAPLRARAEVCYQRRLAEQPSLSGHAFLEVAWEGAGNIVATSVYGQGLDAPLLRCLEEVLASWSLPPADDTVQRVVLPLTLRVELPPPTKGGRRD